MGLGRMGAVVDQFQRLYGGGSIVGLEEWELLRRYLDRGDEDAFRAIVASHGPMVMAVCRRVLGEEVDVEDAFQVTFLILARKAGKLAPGDPIGHWLHGVAYRVALRVRTAAARRQARERSATAREVAPAEDPAIAEIAQVIDEELARLPAKYRGPVVLCYLEGLTHEEAARQLDWPIGTVKGRLSRARDLLKGRLSRRGFAPAQLSMVVGLLQGSRPLVSPSLVGRTAKAALEIAAGRASGMVSASASVLFEEGIRSMFFTKFKSLIAILIVLGTGAAVVAYQGSKGPSDPNPTSEGTKSIEQKPLDHVQKPVDQNFEKKAATKKVATPVLKNGDYDGPVAEWPILADKDPKTLAILKALEKPIPIHFASETPLVDIKKYIQEATQDEAGGLPTGIPIYVDPKSLEMAKKTMASTAICDLEGVPLKTTLRVMLRQIDLTYMVRDGLLTINFDGEEEESPFDRLMELDQQGRLSKSQYMDVMEMIQLRIDLYKLKGQFDAEMRKGGGFQ